MTATADDLEALKKAYRLWSVTSGEHYQTWLDLMADDFEHGTLENGAPGLEFSSELHGKMAMIAYFDGLLRDWHMVCHVADEFLMDQDRIVVLIRTSWQNRQTGKMVDSPAAHVWQFKDGKAISKFEFADSYAWHQAAQPTPETM